MQADLTGRINGHVVVPPETIAEGARQLILTGDQGSVSHTTVQVIEAEGGPTFQRNSLQQLQPITVAAIAETFQLTESRFVRQVQVQFCTVGTGPVRCQIREVENGVPTDVVLADSVIEQWPINDSPAFMWTPFTFDPPVPLIGNVMYAILLITSDPDFTVAIAQQGHYVQPGDGPPPTPRWISQQPYSVGVLLVSSNVSTWSAMQDTDLAFRIFGCLFAPISKSVILGEVIAPDTTDAMVRSIVHRPFGVADAQFEVRHVSSGEAHVDLENIGIQLSARKNGDFRTTALLQGDSKASPLILPTTRLELGNQEDSADYITLPIDAGVAFNLTVIFDALRAGNSSVTVYFAYQNVDGSGNDVINPDGSYAWSWAPVTRQITSLALGNGWNEETWKVFDTQRGIGLDRTTRLKITLSGSPIARPIVKNLRAITILAGGGAGL